jgi:hypothetical protein
MSWSCKYFTPDNIELDREVKTDPIYAKKGEPHTEAL